jgi:hypothetical protein
VDPLFRALALVNVGRGGIPADDPTALVAEWAVADEKPSVLAVVASRALFVLERLTALERAAALALEPFHVLRVKHTLPKFEAPCLIWRKARVLERRLIDVERLAIGSEYGNELRNHVDDRPKLRFGLSHFGQGFGQRRLRTIPLDGDERDVLGLLEQVEFVAVDGMCLRVMQAERPEQRAVLRHDRNGPRGVQSVLQRHPSVLLRRARPQRVGGDV